MPQAKLTITLDDAGDVKIHGPIDNLLLCYGLLERAKDALRARVDEQAKDGKPRIQRAGPGVLPVKPQR